MAKQLFVKLQTPSIELSIKAKDSSGAKDSIIIGFTRYPLKEAEKELKIFQELLEEQLEELKEGNLEPEAIDKFIKSKVLYIKQAKLEIHDNETGKDIELIVPDTRKAKPNDDFWETTDECLAALLDLYLSASPWRSSIITAIQKALLNVDYEDGQLKNS